MDKWDGNDRRQNHSFCTQHIEFAESMATIKQAVLDIKEAIKGGISFKNGMITSLVGIALTLMIQIAVFSYFYGQLAKQVEVNTLRVIVLENRYLTK